jgi:glutamate-1-semialdehyde 2,1-aminomutase
MHADGWWWLAPGASNKGIKRQILKEMLFSQKK